MAEKDEERQYRRREANRANLEAVEDQLERPIPSTSDLRTIERPRASTGQTSFDHQGPSWRAWRPDSSLSSGSSGMTGYSDENALYRSTVPRISDVSIAGPWQTLYNVRHNECERLTKEQEALKERFAHLKEKYERAKIRSAGLKDSQTTLIAKNADMMKTMKVMELKIRDLEQSNTMLMVEQDIQLSLNSDLQTQISLSTRGFGPDPTTEAAFRDERQRHSTEMSRLQNLLEKTQINLTVKSNECISKKNQLEAELATMRAYKMDFEVETSDLLRRLEESNEECFELRRKLKFSGSSAEPSSTLDLGSDDDSSYRTLGWADLSSNPSSSSAMAQVVSRATPADISHEASSSSSESWETSSTLSTVCDVRSRAVQEIESDTVDLLPSKLLPDTAKAEKLPKHKK